MSAHETIIAIDFGLRNIGVAVGNTLSLTSHPLTILQARDGVPDWMRYLASSTSGGLTAYLSETR